MFGTCWEIIRRDVADISTNLAGNLAGFIVSMMCCVLVFLCIQNNLKPTLISADWGPKQPMTLEYDRGMKAVSIHGTSSMVIPSIEEGFCLCDMFSFPLVMNIRNNSIFQEQRARITHPMIQRQLDGQNQPTQPEHINQINCPTKPWRDVSRIDYGRINYHVKYKPLSKFQSS